MPLKTVSGKHADPRKGRGAGINPEGRFEKEQREAFDDGWDKGEEELPPLKTIVTAERVSSIITRNNSPDIPFTQSINPYAGCEHGCIYCVDGDTPILMADGRTRRLADIRAGDEIYGTVRDGWYRRYAKDARARALERDQAGLSRNAGRRHVAGRRRRSPLSHRARLEIRHRHHGQASSSARTSRPATSSWARALLHCRSAKDRDYRLGYLCGMIRGDGLLASYRLPAGRPNAWRPAPVPPGPVRHGSAAENAGISGDCRDCDAGIRVPESGRRATDHARHPHACALERRTDPFPDRMAFRAFGTWMAGFLAGIFDAEGSCSQGVLRISNTDQEIIGWIDAAWKRLNFASRQEHVHREHEADRRRAPDRRPARALAFLSHG